MINEFSFIKYRLGKFCFPPVGYLRGHYTNMTSTSTWKSAISPEPMSVCVFYSYHQRFLFCCTFPVPDLILWGCSNGQLSCTHFLILNMEDEECLIFCDEKPSTHHTNCEGASLSIQREEDTRRILRTSSAM